MHSRVQARRSGILKRCARTHTRHVGATLSSVRSEWDREGGLGDSQAAAATAGSGLHRAGQDTLRDPAAFTSEIGSNRKRKGKGVKGEKGDGSSRGLGGDEADEGERTENERPHIGDGEVRNYAVASVCEAKNCNESATTRGSLDPGALLARHPDSYVTAASNAYGVAFFREDRIALAS